MMSDDAAWAAEVKRTERFCERLVVLGMFDQADELRVAMARAEALRLKVEIVEAENARLRALVQS
jgi:hypothetical protein